MFYKKVHIDHFTKHNSFLKNLEKNTIFRSMRKPELQYFKNGSFDKKWCLYKNARKFISYKKVHIGHFTKTDSLLKKIKLHT